MKCATGDLTHGSLSPSRIHTQSKRIEPILWMFFKLEQMEWVLENVTPV